MSHPRIDILRELVARRPTDASKLFTYTRSGVFEHDRVLMQLMMGCRLDKPETVANAVQYYAAIVCNGDPVAHDLCMQINAKYGIPSA